MMLKFAVSFVAVDLILLRKKIKLPITAEKNQQSKKSLETLWSEGYCAKTNKAKIES